jgi:serine beta-lactamase-like protein LACTB
MLNNFRRESVTLIRFWLSHSKYSGRLGVNLSVPGETMKHKLLPGLLAITFTACICLQVPALAQPALNSPQLTQMLTAMENIFTEQRMVGLQGAIFDGQEIHTLNMGYADLEHQVSVAAETRFEIASVTKAFTGLGLLRLAESGELDLDAPVQRYVPEFPEKAEGAITSRQLAGALAGIRHYQDERDEVFYATHYDSVIEALNVFKDDTLLATPGTESHYSSYGFNLLAAVIERASGQPFATTISELLLSPMGLQNTGFTDVRIPLSNRSRHYSFIDLYSREALPTIHIIPTLDHSYNMGGGNMYSTASDLVNFGRQLLAPGLLSEAIIAQVLSPHMQANGQPGDFSDGWVMLGHQASPRFLMAGGSYPGTLSLLLVFPDSQVVAAMVSNTWGKDGPDVMEQLLMQWVRTQ